MSMTVTVKSTRATSLHRVHMRGFFLNFCGTTVPDQDRKTPQGLIRGGGVPDLALPSHTVLRLGAIHKRSRVPNLMYVVNALCFCMCANTFGMDHSTLSGFDPLN